MSQVNIQSLLSLDPVEPVQTTPTPIQYNQSSFQGGNVRPGQLAQLPKSSEELLFANLSQIAAGTSQALQTFGNIASEIDRDRINRIEAEWEKIDAEPINPKDKVTKFTPILQQVSTPMSGSTWKERLTAKIAKSWGSREAFEKYVETEFITQSKAWEKYDGKMGPVRTQEFLRVFGEKNPTLTQSEFFVGLTKANQAQLQEQNDTFIANNLVIVAEHDYGFEDQTILDWASGKLNLDQYAKLNPHVVSSIQLAHVAGSYDEFEKLFNEKWNNHYNQEITRLTPEVANTVKLRLDGYRQNLVKKLWNASGVISQGQNSRQLQSNVQTSLATFLLAPNDETSNTLRDQSLILLSDLNAQQQANYLQQVVANLYEGLSSNKWPGNENFAALPLPKQMEVLREKLKTILPDTDEIRGTKDGKGILKQDIFGSNVKPISDMNGVYDYLIRGFQLSEKGQQLKSTVIDSARNTASLIQALNESAVRVGEEPWSIEKITTTYVEQLARKTGLDKNILQRVFVIQEPNINSDGTPVLGEDGKPILLFKLRNQSADLILLDPKIRSEFSKIGFGEQDVNTLLQEYNTALGPVSQSGGKRQKEPTLETPKYKDPGQAQVGLINDEKLIKQALIILDPSSGVEQDDPKYIDAAMLRDQALKMNGSIALLGKQMAIQAAMGALADPDTADQTSKQYELWLKKENGSILTTPENEEVKKFEATVIPKALEFLGVSDFNELVFFEIDSNGNFTNTLNPNTLKQKSSWVDTTGNLTPAGRRLGLRTLFRAKIWANNPQVPGHAEFVSNLKDQLETLSTTPWDSPAFDHALFYEAAYGLKGLKAGAKEPIGLGNLSTNEFKYFNKLMEFIAVHEIPENTQQKDSLTRTFMIAFDLGVESLALTAQGGSLDTSWTGTRTDSPQDGVISGLTNIANGNHSFLMERTEQGKEQDPPENYSLTLRFGKFFRLPNIDITLEPETQANQILTSFYQYIHPTISPGTIVNNNGIVSNLVIPAPDSNDQSYIALPQKGSNDLLYVQWNKATPDQKLTYYTQLLLRKSNDEVFSIMMYPLIAGQVLDNYEETATPQEKEAALQVLLSSKAEYLKSKRQISNVIYPSMHYYGGSFSWMGIWPTGNWGIRKDMNTTVPTIQNTDPNLQPSSLITNAIKQVFPTGTIWSMDQIDDFVDDVSVEENPENSLVAPIAEAIHADNSPETKLGVYRGFDPTDMFVVGVLSAEPTPESIEYLFNVLGIGPYTYKQLYDTQQAVDQKRIDFQLKNNQNSILEIIENSFHPTIVAKVKERLLDFRLGVGRSEKVKFGKTLDGTTATLDFKKGNTPYSIKIEKPILPSGSLNNEVSQTEALTRFLKTIKYLHDITEKAASTQGAQPSGRPQ